MSLYDRYDTAIRTVLADADALIAALEAAKVAAAADLAAAVAETRRVTDALSEARAETTHLQDEVGGLQQENADTLAALGAVRGERDALDTRVAGLTAGVAVLRARIAELEGAQGPGTMTVGALRPGQASYPVPTSGPVLFVSPSGDDYAAGTEAAPKRTVKAAMSSAASGATIVLRAGTYRESVTTPSSKPLTLQPYPGEEVWFDGSAVYSSWTSNGNGTWTTGYTISHIRFNADRYKGDDPCRNHPDQVWVDDVALTQVADDTTPAAGRFSVHNGAYALRTNTSVAGKSVEVRIDGVTLSKLADGVVTPGAGQFSVQGATVLHVGTNTLTGKIVEVKVDGAALTRATDDTAPTSGRFSAHRRPERLVIGTNQSGKSVRVAELVTAFTVTSPLTLRGVGVRGFSPNAIEGINAMIFYGGSSHGSVLEHVWFADSAMASISVTKTNVRVSDCTFEDNGHSGIMGTNCDGLIVERCAIRRMNGGQWQAEPTTAGIKLTRCDKVTVRLNHISQCPKAYGVWFDVSCTRTSFYGNVVDGGGTMMNALEIELSDGGFYDGVQHHSIVASNWLTGASGKSAAAGVLLFDTGYVKVWNNDLRRNGIPAYLWQDERVNNGDSGNKTFAICPWRTRGNEVVNNILDSGVGANIQFAAYAQNGDFGLLGADMFTRLSGNHFAAAPPGSMAQLGRSTGARTSYNTPTALASAGAEVGSVTGKVGRNHQGPDAAPADLPDPLPADIAALLGVPTGTRAVGPVTPALSVRS